MVDQNSIDSESLNENNADKPMYTDMQFARYVSKTLFFKIRDIENSLREMQNGKFFTAKDYLVGVKDSLVNLKIQTDRRLDVLESNTEDPT